MPWFEWATGLPHVMLTFGVLVTAALFAGVLGQVVRLPRVTSFLLMGVLLGPSIPEKHVDHIEPLTKLAIALVLFNLGCHFPLVKVRRIIRIQQEPMSLDTPVGNEENSLLGDFIEDDSIPGPAEAASGELLREQVHNALDQLSRREREVLEMRFGIKDGQAHTLEEVGHAFGVTRERIRQIEAKALRKLRHPIRSRKLRDYLGE